MSIAATHVCPVAGCTASLPQRILLCMLHWRQVPYEIQQEVRGLWREDPISARYLAARQKAIDAVDARNAGPVVAPAEGNR